MKNLVNRLEKLENTLKQEPRELKPDFSNVTDEELDYLEKQIENNDPKSIETDAELIRICEKIIWK